MRKRTRPQPSRPDNPNRPNTKRTGERSEAAFLYQASQRRFAISKPWGDSERYDFILDNRPRFGRERATCEATNCEQSKLLG